MSDLRELDGHCDGPHIHCGIEGARRPLEADLPAATLTQSSLPHTRRME